MNHLNLSNNTLPLLKAFMASHAVFNALTYVQHQIAVDEKRAALKALSVFANFIRKTADEVDAPTRTLKKEIELLKLYCQLEQWRFADRLTIEIEEPKNELTQVPTFLFVPFTEQIILMGLSSKKENLKLSIAIKDTSSLCLTCNFNLEPIKIEELNAEQSNRAQLLNERIEIFGQEYKINIDYTAQVATLIIKPK